MRKIPPVRLGVALAAFDGLFHAAWSALVALHWAQPILDFVFWMHFMRLPVQVQPFDLGLAALLVSVTSVLGFAFGMLLAVLWNWAVAE